MRGTLEAGTGKNVGVERKAGSWCGGKWERWERGGQADEGSLNFRTIYGKAIGLKTNGPALAPLPSRPVATIFGKNQATVRPVFIFAATSTEIRQPTAR